MYNLKLKFMKTKIFTLFFCLLTTMGIFAQEVTEIYPAEAAFVDFFEPRDATPMSDMGNGTFVWIGQMKPGEFTFTVNCRCWENRVFSTQAPVGDRGWEEIVIGQKHDIILSFGNAEPDWKFQMTGEEGWYKMTIDLNDNTLLIEPYTMEAFETDELWMIGSGVINGPVKLTKTSEGRFTFGGQIQTGEIKFMNTPTETAETKYLVPLAANQDIASSLGMLIATADPTAKGWEEAYVYSDELYKMLLDINGMNYKFSFYVPPYDLFLVGGATINGWFNEDGIGAIPFERDDEEPYIFRLTTELAVNDDGRDEPNKFKLLLNEDNWSPAYHPLFEDENIESGKPYMVLDGAGDYKWTLAEEQAGEYLIIVNTLLDEISFYKGGEASNKFVVTDEVSIITEGNTIKLIADTKIENVNLYDISGKKVASINQIGKEITISNLQRGSYIITYESNNLLKTKKVLIY